jgi:type 1 glutamine amidotransferase
VRGDARHNRAMRTSARAARGIAAVALGLAAAGLIACSSDPEAKPQPRAKVLVFYRTAGFRHDSIPAGIAAIRSLGRTNGFSVATTNVAAVFTRRHLQPFDAVVFLSTTGDVLPPKQQRAFKGYIRQGGGWVGIHSAADTEYDWPFYGRLLGAYFQSHPAIQSATVDVTDRSHPSTRHLPARWTRTDEWYDFRSNPRGAVHILATLDESTYSGGTMGADHPIAWCHAFRGGRAWYTAGGHTSESYSEPAFRRHLLGGILWAARLANGDCRP